VKEDPLIQAIFDVMEDEIIVVGDDRRLIMANKAVKQKYGISEIGEGICYQVLFGLEGPCRGSFWSCPLEEVLETCRGKMLLFSVVLMDIVMPVMNGLEATKEILKLRPESKILILTQYDEEENLLVARQVGAYGFIPKRAASSALLEGIRTVGKGQYYPPSFGEGGGAQAIRGSFI